MQFLAIGWVRIRAFTIANPLHLLECENAQKHNQRTILFFINHALKTTFKTFVIRPLTGKYT